MTIEELSAVLAALQEDMRDVKIQVMGLQGRVDALEGKLSGRMDALEGKLGGRIDSLEGHVMGLEGRLANMELMMRVTVASQLAIAASVCIAVIKLAFFPG